jgi:Fe-S-cluster containining protein
MARKEGTALTLDRAKAARLDRLRALHARLLQRGVAVEGTQELAESMALLFHDCLINLRDRRRVLRAAQLAHRLYDNGEVRAPLPRPLACKAGCDYCCYGFVSVLAPEAFLLAEAIKREDGGALSPKSFQARATSVRGLDQRARFQAERSPCPALANRLCALHAERPLSCRRHNSFSAEACVEALNGGKTAIPTNAAYQAIGGTCSVTLRAGLKASGYSPALYELTDAVCTILETEDALRRWTSGEDILASVRTDTSTPPHFKAAIDGLAAAIS